ncbi:MAG: type I phosphomannose isomerase catalytic subunit [Armatimonadota bacterium]
MLYPLRFAPLLFEKVWGDHRLKSIMGRQLPPNTLIGESWEVADHPHGRSVVANGTLAGRTLREVIALDPQALLGTRVSVHGHAHFPLLVKYIDAEEALSVQVHPPDEYARAHGESFGKTEMWYILHADPGATLIVGLQDGVTREQFRQALEDGDPGSLLYQMPVKTGESIHIPAGRIHAIMPGLLILEIQQNSDITYRLYDWGRVGLDGKPRELHIEQAMDVANWSDYTPSPQAEHVHLEGANRRAILATCEYFLVEKYALAAERIFSTDAGSFTIVNCVAGRGELAWAGGTESLTFGDSLLIPASLTDFTLLPDGEAVFIMSSVP